MHNTLLYTYNTLLYIYTIQKPTVIPMGVLTGDDGAGEDALIKKRWYPLWLNDFYFNTLLYKCQ